jgi:ankyrin repeat protein
MADEGATPRELLIESSRRNNTTLLADLLASPPLNSNSAAIAKFLNTTTDALGASALHIAAQYGSYEVLDTILDQEGVEIDGQEKREGDTALHKAVRYANESSAGGRGREVVEILVDAGCDPRIRNKGKLRPIDLVDPRNTELRNVLQKAEMAMMAGDDVVDEDEDEPDGPGSESD